ncbi:putative reverse transcriptase domain protein [Mycena venus]|uniref:Putative reverse transcriptase domain protein n=1 Tax=Mycena venus TaxID=2733690 RepID=A0A8H6X5J4_9AGAR|nr:putative reverse transcriptase domain protein [Mycena venus]
MSGALEKPTKTFKFAKKTIDPHAVVVPVHVEKILRAGWTKYFPLADLNDENSDQIFAKAAEYESKASDTGISPADFMLCSAKLTEAIRSYFEPQQFAGQLADRLENHFANIVKRSDFQTNTHRYVIYNTAILQRFADGRRTYGKSSASGTATKWPDASADDAKRREEEDRRRGQRSGETHGQQWQGNRGNGGGSSGADSFRNARHGFRTSNEGTSAGNDTTDGQTRGRRERANQEDTHGRCIFCGARERHNSFYCPEDTGPWYKRVSGRNGTGPHPSEASASATRTTYPQTAPRATASSPMAAPSAEPAPPQIRRRPTAPRDALATELLPIVTPLVADRWEHWIARMGVTREFADVPEGIRNGFSHGIDPDLRATKTFIPKNLTSALEHPDVIDAYLAKEQHLGRISPPYDPTLLEQIIGPFRCSPIGCVQKDPPDGKWRMFNHHSFPRNDPDVPSINSQIDKENYPCDWGSFVQCYLIVARAPAGAEACVFDVKSAFRNVPTLPEERSQLMISWRDKVYFDHVFSFGATSAPGIFGRIADLLVLLLKHHSVEDILKWVDDFIFFRYLKQNPDGSTFFLYDETLFTKLAEELGWLWEMEKHTPFAKKFTYLGFDWRLTTKTVSLPEKKRTKYRGKVQAWLPTITDTTTDAARGHHGLQEGRGKRVSMYRLQASLNQAANPYVRYRLPPEVKADAQWWIEALSAERVELEIRQPPPLGSDVIFVDASTSWGVGLVFRGRWLAWKFKEGWRANGRNIGWAEMVAVELAVRTVVASGVANAHIALRSDNQGVIGALAAGRSYGIQENAILQHILFLFHKHRLWFSITYVNTKENPADAPSRGILPPRTEMYQRQPRTPDHLRSLLYLVLN